MQHQKTDLQRRTLLKTLTLGTVAAGAVTASLAATASSTGEQSAATNEPSQGYRETAHIRDYYNSLR